MTKIEYDEDYYEKGVEKGLSGYENYRWLPHYVLPMANELKKRYGDEVLYLDYGCAKGFLVKALRMLGCEAVGYDISQYAVDKGEDLIKESLTTNKDKVTEAGPQVIIAKDVLEHLTEEELKDELQWMFETSNFVVVVVPLGDNDKYRIREYEIDKTHVLRKDEEWWFGQFENAGFKIQEFYYSLPGFKDNWTEEHPYGNGIFFLTRI